MNADDLAEVHDIGTHDDTPLADLPPAEQRARAQEMARADAALTGKELAARFGRRERWGRNQARAARPGTARKSARGSARSRRTAAPKPETKTAQPTARHRKRPLWAERAVLGVTGTALAVVVLSPLALSFHGLAGWGRDALGLTEPLTYLVPVTLDAAALVCVGLAFHAMLRADSAGAARLLVWVFAAASALANYRHAHTISPDAAAYYASMPLVSAVLLDITLRRIRRSALSHLGALEQPLPRYRAARWIVAPRETWRAWCHAVRHGITDPNEALAASQSSVERHAAQEGQ